MREPKSPVALRGVGRVAMWLQSKEASTGVDLVATGERGLLSTTS